MPSFLTAAMSTEIQDTPQEVANPQKAAYLSDPHFQKMMMQLIQEKTEEAKTAKNVGDVVTAKQCVYNALVLLEFLEGNMNVEEFFALKNKQNSKKYTTQLDRHYAMVMMLNKYGEDVNVEDHVEELLKLYVEWGVEKAWEGRIMPEVETVPAFRKVSLLMMVIPLGQEDTGFMLYPSPSLAVWWAAEDAHSSDPVGTEVMVWREKVGSRIYEGWIERVVTSSTEIQWMHELTWYPIDGTCVLPRA